MKKNTRSQSITRKVYLLLAIVMVIQVSMFGCAIIFGGTIGQLKTNAVAILNERVINRKSYLKNEMTSRWSNFSEHTEAINAQVTETLSGQPASVLAKNPEQSEGVLMAIRDELITLLRRNGVTGAFVVLTGEDTVYSVDPGKTEEHAGLYFRTSEPKITTKDNSDLSIVRAPTSIVKSMGISIAPTWEPKFVFDGDYPERYAFYSKPLLAEKDNKQLAIENLGYWAPSFSFEEDKLEMITYTQPLRDAEGVVYGVLGVEISSNYIKNILPASELDDGLNASYILGVSESKQTVYRNEVISGPAYKKLADNTDTTYFDEKAIAPNTYALDDNTMEEEVLGNIHTLNLYNSNTPFSGDRWALIGIEAEDSLFAFANGVFRTILVAALIALCLGAIAVMMAGRLAAKPIEKLVTQVRESNPKAPINLSKTHITEIDELSGAIEKMSRDIVDSASKLSRIIDIADVPIAAFEYNKENHEVFYTNIFFSLLGQEDHYTTGYMEGNVFWKRMEACGVYTLQMKTIGEEILEMVDEEGQIRWISWKYTDDENSVLGVIRDVTAETLEVRKIEHERDYDSLTNLLNRHAFHRILTELFETPASLKTAAMLMLDLDNLKYINDSYGHDMGDEYIRGTAKVLKQFASPGVVVARQSGDEFYVFFYGFSNRDEIQTIVSELRNQLLNTKFLLLRDPDLKIRASAGIAWYPEDARDFEQLQKFADFAMYQAKMNSKGELYAYNPETYRNNVFLLNKGEKLNQLFEKNLVNYYFQPIVDLNRGRVMAYELLMRSQMENLQSPLEILALAKSQSKLHQIEKFTWFNALKAVKAQQDKVGDSLIFINSVSNQILTNEEIVKLEKEYRPYLKNVVVELTEEERIDEKITRKKVEIINKWGAALALDDYGTGYNGDASLLFVSPEYVKIDMSIIRDIDKDIKRRHLLESIIPYLKERKIKAIAEGVETAEELATLIHCGIEYVQGYYLGLPAPEPTQLSETHKMEIRKMQQGI